MKLVGDNAHCNFHVEGGFDCQKAFKRRVTSLRTKMFEALRHLAVGGCLSVGV